MGKGNLQWWFYRSLKFFGIVFIYRLWVAFDHQMERSVESASKLRIFYFYFMSFFQLVIFFSSPEPKAQVSFSDQNLSVVRRRCRRRRCRCRKLFTFSSSSPEPLGQFQPNLAQSILGWRGFKFVQMKGAALFQGKKKHWRN